MCELSRDRSAAAIDREATRGIGCRGSAMAPRSGEATRLEKARILDRARISRGRLRIRAAHCDGAATRREGTRRAPRSRRGASSRAHVVVRGEGAQSRDDAGNRGGVARACARQEPARHRRARRRSQERRRTGRAAGSPADDTHVRCRAAAACRCARAAVSRGRRRRARASHRGRRSHRDVVPGISAAERSER